MPMTFDGSGTITGLAAGGLPDATITQADLATGVSGTGPAFSAQATTTQSISNTTYTKITLGTENFDTNGNFASSTFTPTVAGYYQINAGIFYNASATAGLGQILIYKNGVAANNTVNNMSSAGYCGLSISTLIYCNGSTDYIELYTYHAFGSSQATSSGTSVYMNGALVRAA
jgi:hypothetical protein